jgi:hypothetical protein
VKALSSVNDVIPQDLDYPGLELNIDREHLRCSTYRRRGRSTPHWTWPIQGIAWGSARLLS